MTLSVILSEAKNLLILKEEILRTYVLWMTRKGKFIKTLENYHLKTRLKGAEIE
jgi:hypothetical protein